MTIQEVRDVSGRRPRARHGGGAIGVPLYGMLGGYALSGRGPRWARILSGAVALTAIPVWVLTVTSFAGPGLAVDTPRGAWVAVYYWSFLAVLLLACAIPHRAVTPQHVAERRWNSHSSPDGG
jgi:hypothetical protein